jgi:hypothetical protein
MIGTDKVAEIFRKKLVIDPIKGDPDMATAVHIGNEITLVIDQHSFERLASALQNEFLARPVSQFADLPHQ